jgi:hypothetical protein
LGEKVVERKHRGIILLQKNNSTGIKLVLLT